MSHGLYSVAVPPVPHPAIPLAVFLIVEAALSEAWRRLKSKDPCRIDIETATEDEITHELYEILFDEVFGHGIVEGFDDERFTVVTREAKIRNFDGKKLDKMPDLLVGLANREDVWRKTQDWLFIECKPVGVSHSVGVHYGSKGISRFVKGEYAWAMPSALMVGYTVRGYSVVPKLADVLVKRRTEFQVLQGPEPCRRSAELLAPNGVFTTLHGRLFQYVETGDDAPPVFLRHLWLSRDN